MTPFEVIKQRLTSNIYRHDKIVSYLNRSKNLQFLNELTRIANIDPIFDYDTFKNAVINLKRSKTDWIGFHLLGGDSLLYGHLWTLTRYSNQDFTDTTRLLFPYIEHGISWLDLKKPIDEQKYVHCMITQGPYRHNAIRASRNIPHYTIGPFIHYANTVLNNSQLKHIKEKLGRTLLVFPVHTYESSNASYERKRYVENVINQFGNDFDTILVSAYWNDVDDEIFDLFTKHGAKIVSSGLREDHNFISRLKTLLMLSDTVIGNGLGTQIGYCYYLKKRFILFEGNERARITEPDSFVMNGKSQSALLSSVLSEFKSAFAISPKSYKQKTKQLSLFEHYWGGQTKIRTPEEIKELFAISQDMLDAANGSIFKADSAYKACLSSYLSSTSKESKIKYSLLSEALA